MARSHTSYIMMLNGAPVHWRSVKQPCTSLSSACAEIYALSEACKDARLMQWRAEELGLCTCIMACCCSGGQQTGPVIPAGDVCAD